MYDYNIKEINWAVKIKGVLR